MLDLDAVAAFVLVADLQSFTRAAEVLGTTQSTISLKIKRLEASLGRRLLERTPRLVRLADGCEGFLASARLLLAQHEQAMTALTVDDRRLSIGISDHVAGRDLPAVLATINGFDPGLLLDVRIGLSRDLLDRYDRGAFDAVVIRKDDDRRDGEMLFKDRYCWMAAPSWRRPANQPLPLASLADPCGARALATKALDRANIPWRDAFIGGGVSAVGAALTAGLAVAALAVRVAPVGTVDVGATFGLPELPTSQVVLHSRVFDPRSSAALRLLGAGFRSGNS